MPSDPSSGGPHTIGADTACEPLTPAGSRWHRLGAATERERAARWLPHGRATRSDRRTPSFQLPIPKFQNAEFVSPTGLGLASARALLPSGAQARPRPPAARLPVRGARACAPACACARRVRVPAACVCPRAPACAWTRLARTGPSGRVPARAQCLRVRAPRARARACASERVRLRGRERARVRRVRCLLARRWCLRGSRDASRASTSASVISLATSTLIGPSSLQRASQFEANVRAACALAASNT